MKSGKNSSDYIKRRRRLRIQIRLSPNGKSKGPTKLHKKRGTGVAASHPDYPTSTNVSSPVQAASRRRLVQVNKTTRPVDLPRTDYARDEVSDKDDPNHHEPVDESDEGFEPIRELGKPKKSAKRQLGPPITTDEKIASLNEIHRIVLDNFMGKAKAYIQKVRLDASYAKTCVVLIPPRLWGKNR